MSDNGLNVFNIEKFAIHDGSGIRTAVFFQGCPMRCPWCANPESQSVGTHIMHTARFCVGCGRCAKACPQKAVTISSGKAEIDRKICDSCGKCAEVCLNNAIKISGKKMSCNEIFDVVVRDKDYYSESGGGVTLSGGEALMNIDPILPLLEIFRKYKISVAVETCGCVLAENIERAIEYIDEFLFDLKSLDAAKLKKVTGGDLKTILDSFNAVCEKCPEKVTVRVPVIPEFNYDEITDIIEFAARNGIKRLHLLPYHTLGITKYEQLGIEYPYPVTAALEPVAVEQFKEYGEKIGLSIKIGG